MASALSGRSNEGRSRRRKDWKARKRFSEEKELMEVETLARSVEVEKLTRRASKDNYLRLDMEGKRRLRIDKLSSEKVWT